MRRWRLSVVATALATLLLVPMAFAARAANGDELRGEYHYDPASLDNFFPVTLARGTGRFAAASGAVIVRYDVIPVLIRGCVPGPDPFLCFDFSVPWQWSATMTGTISY